MTGSAPFLHLFSPSRLATEHARETRVYHPYHYSQPPSRVALAPLRSSYGHQVVLPPASKFRAVLLYPPYIPVMIRPRRIPTALLRRPLSHLIVSRPTSATLRDPPPLSPLFSISPTPRRSACKWFKCVRTLIPLRAKRCEAHRQVGRILYTSSCRSLLQPPPSSNERT